MLLLIVSWQSRRVTKLQSYRGTTVTRVTKLQSYTVTRGVTNVTAVTDVTNVINVTVTTDGRLRNYTPCSYVIGVIRSSAQR